jgi:hypothetical protein
MKYFWRLRYWIRPDVRQALDGFGVFFAITLFFCLLEGNHGSFIHHVTEQDQFRWWWPLYRALGGGW